MPDAWRKCSSCKNEILLGQAYYVCSVSTCQRGATNYVFCSVDCWDAHIPIERHKGDSAGAIERKAPTTASAADPVSASSPRRVIATSAPRAATASEGGDEELLVVVSKVRKYIADRSGMNTSASTYVALTERIKRICDRAIETARSQNRKTVMDRDVP